MTNISALALQIDQIAKGYIEDPFELFRAASPSLSSVPHPAITHPEAVEEVRALLTTLNLSQFELIRLDRLVFDGTI
jgi:hypothetical protein